MARYQFVSRPELPRFAGGAVGFIGYEAIHFFEPKVPLAQHRMNFSCPKRCSWFRARSGFRSSAAQLENRRQRISRAMARPEKVYARAVECLASIKQQLTQPVDLSLVPIAEDGEQPVAAAASNFSREEFERAVKRAKEYIRAGDVFQVVLSQRFESPFDGEPLDFYRCLRFINPSPYMFCLNFGGDFSLVGSSPEMHVRSG